mgnify:CR=1 FL=1
MPPKTCPQCGCLADADGKSCSCGWRAASKKEASAERQCNGLDGSVRCKVEGWLSHNVRGGPWYCRRHMSISMGLQEDGPRPSNAGYMQSIRDLVKRKSSFGRMREPGEDAEEIT